MNITKTLCLLISTLFLTFAVYGQCEENITLSSQEEIDNFATNYGCTAIEGDLTISITTYELINLQGLQALTSISGTLKVTCPIFENFEGLNNLTSLGYVSINYVNEDMSFAGLENITTLTGIQVFNMDGAISFEGLNNLTTIEEYLYFNAIRSTINFEGLENLASIGTNFTMTNIDYAVDFQPLESLTMIGGDLRVEDVDYDVSFSFEGLGSLTTIGGFFYLENIPDFSDFSGLHNVTTIGGSMGLNAVYPISNYESLESLTSLGGVNITSSNVSSFAGLENITEFDLGIYLIDTYTPTNFEGLNNLTSVGSNFVMDNAYITSFSGLENLTYIGGFFRSRENTAGYLNFTGLDNLTYLGALQVEGASITSFTGLNLTQIEGSVTLEGLSITDFTGLENLTSVGSLHCNTMYDLENFEGLNNLIEIRGHLVLNDIFLPLSFSGLDNLSYIKHNFSLTDCDIENFVGLENLLFIGGDLYLNDVENIVDFEGLNNVKSIEDNLQVIETDIVTFNGLESVEYIDNDLILHNNTNLESIDGLQSLFNIGGSVEMEYNFDLEECCILACLADLEVEDITLYNNGTACNDYDDIEDNCSSSDCYQIAYVEAFAYHDLNGNGTYDTGEYPLVNQAFSLEPDATYSYTNAQGTVKFLLGQGTEYTLTLEDNSLWELTTESNQYTATLNDEAIQHSFGLTPTSIISEVSGDINSGANRCGFEVNYWLSYENTGTTTAQGVISFAPDSLIELVSVEPAPSYEQDDVLYWDFEDLDPSYGEQIQMVFQMPGVEFIGTVLTSEGNIAITDDSGVTLTEDTFLYSRTLTCAYDPNDKLVTPEGIGENKHTLLEDSLLTYTVRFQNTGNDTAFNVIIRDIIDENLDIETFQFVSSSHEVVVEMAKEERRIDFLFNDIYLPDSNINELASHGFIKFSIEINEGLLEQTEVENTAAIFFDFNPPIITNTTLNTFVENYPILIANANLKVFLEGAYNPMSGLMKTSLQDLSLLPLNQPFNVAPYNYFGLESVSSEAVLPANIVDWILVEARSGMPSVTNANTTVVESIAGFLLADGSIVSVYGNALAFRELTYGEPYHFVIRHRNHLDIISNEPVVAEDQMVYDFDLAQDQAFGTSQQKVLADGKVVMYTGDYSQDGIIQITDFDLWKEAPAQNNVYGNTDGTIDGIIQVTDYDAWIPNKAKIGNIEIQY